MDKKETPIEEREENKKKGFSIFGKRKEDEDTITMSSTETEPVSLEMDIVLPEGEELSVNKDNLESVINEMSPLEKEGKEETEDEEKSALEAAFDEAFDDVPLDPEEFSKHLNDPRDDEEASLMPYSSFDEVKEEPKKEEVKPVVKEEVKKEEVKVAPKPVTEIKYAFQKNLVHPKKERREVKLNTHAPSEEELALRKEKRQAALDRKALRDGSIPDAREVAKRVYLRDARDVARANDERVEEAKLRRKASEVKVESNGQKLAKERIQRAIKTPFTYYYDCCRDAENNNIYCTVSQCMNDKFAGRIYQPQYFAIAEESDRIFTVNFLLLQQAIGQAQLWPDTIFSVQLSPRYLEKGERYQELRNIMEVAPKNIIYCMECRPLVMTGERGRDRLRELVNDFGIKIMIDTPETERLSLLFDYPMEYIRLDGRYYRDRAVSKFKFVKLLATYCKIDNISLCAQYVDTPEDKNWLLKNGVRYLQGQAIEPIKATVKTALNAGPVKASRFQKSKQTNAAEDALVNAKSMEGRDLEDLDKIEKQN